MWSDRTASASGDPSPSSNGVDPHTSLETLQAKCRHQAVVIDRLSDAVSMFYRGARALKAENSELRAENARLRDDWRSSARAGGRLDDGGPVEVMIALDARAPGAARTVVAQFLGERVVASDLYSARLLVSELVTNSLRHSGGPAGDQVVVSVALKPDSVRIGVQDSGLDAVIAVRPLDVQTGAGLGLNLVRMLSERWGVERLAGGGTQVWAQLLRSPPAGAGDFGDDSAQVANRAA